MQLAAVLNAGGGDVTGQGVAAGAAGPVALSAGGFADGRGGPGLRPSYPFAPPRGRA